MTLAVTQKFEELIIDVEFDPVGASGTYTAVCGVKEATVNRQANVDNEEIPDCDDESLPFAVDKSVRSIEVTVDGTGVWAKSSHDKMMDWFYSGAPLNVRVRNTAVATGEIETESGAALLTQLSNQKTKGKVVSATIRIEFKTKPTTTVKS